MEAFIGFCSCAESIFRSLYEKSPANFIASNELALALLAMDGRKKHQQATQYAQVHSGRHKDLRTVVGRQAAATLAYGLHKLGRTAAAERVIQQVITSGEVSPQIGYFAAVIFRNCGRRDVAKQLLQKSLSSYIAFPEQESARQLLKDILVATTTEGVESRSANPQPE
ncbi:MAG: hypothetical protein ABGZ53_00295 [Fuerstiella sp.]